MRVEELRARLDRRERVVVVDARSPTDYALATEQLPGSVRVPPDEVDDHVAQLQRAATVIAYCT
jgi:rhodanese-related sulfurtransferase